MTLLAPAPPDDRYGMGYAVAAYAVIFVAFFAYVGWLHVSHRRLRRRLDALDRKLPRPAD